MNPGRACEDIESDTDMMDIDESQENDANASDDARIRQVLHGTQNPRSDSGKAEAPPEPQNEPDGKKFLDSITRKRRREITDHVLYCIRHFERHKKPPLEEAVAATVSSYGVSKTVAQGVFRFVKNVVDQQNARGAQPHAPHAPHADVQDPKHQHDPMTDSVRVEPESEESFSQWQHRLRNCTLDEIKTLIDDMYSDFGGNESFLHRDDENESERLGRIMQEVFNSKHPGPVNLGIDLISDRAERYNAKAVTLHMAYLREKADDDDWQEHSEKLNAIFIRNSLIRSIRESTSQYILTFHPSYRSFWTNMQGLNQIIPDPDTSKIQDALLFCTSAAQAEGLQHNGDRVMKPIKIDNKPIRAFKLHYDDMKEWIYSLTRNVKGRENQIMHTERGLVKSIAETLSQCNYDVFPKYKPDDAWVAFRNGMLNLYTDEFFAHDDVSIPRDVVAFKFHNCDLPWEELKQYVGDWDNPLWANIDTPMKKIYELQYKPGEGENDEIIKFFLAFIGRCMFPHGVFDDWQLAPCFFGNAKTGKSVVLAAIATFFNDEDISTIGNTTQSTFGLEACVGSKMTFMEEITHAIGLDQGAWNSMVTGGQIEISIKHGKAKSVNWKSRLVMAGNEGLGSYNNMQGSMVRRILVFMFQNRPLVMDTMLKKRLENNPSKFIVMCMRAYRALVAKVEQVSPFAKDLKSLVPTYFQEQRALMASDSSPMERMLMNPEYVVFPTSKDKSNSVYVPERVLFDVFKIFCKDQSIAYTHPSTTTDKMLLQYGITRAKTRSKSGRSYKMYPRPLNEPYISPKTPTTGKKFFVGVDVSARHAYSDRVPPLPTEAFCESSCAYKTSLHYQGGNDNCDAKDENAMWDYNVFMQKYEEHVSIKPYDTVCRLAFIHGLDQARKFYSDTMDHLDEILSGLTNSKQLAVTSMIDEMKSCIGKQSSSS